MIRPLCTLEAWIARFRPRRPPTEEALRRHAAAESAGEDTYADPATGRRVYTATALVRVGSCCRLECRHCPWPR